MLSGKCSLMRSISKFTGKNVITKRNECLWLQSAESKASDQFIESCYEAVAIGKEDVLPMPGVLTQP